MKNSFRSPGSFPPDLDTISFSLFNVGNLRNIEEVIKKDIRDNKFAEALASLDLIKEVYPDFYDLTYFGNLHRFEKSLLDEGDKSRTKIQRAKPAIPVAKEELRDAERQDRYAFLTPDDRKKVEAINSYIEKEELNAAQDMLNILKRSSETIDYFTVEILQGKIESIKDRQKMEAWGGIDNSASIQKN